MKPNLTAHEMADWLLAVANSKCKKPFGVEGYTCREYDAAAMYDSRDAVCERCQACDALDRLRSPHKTNAHILVGALRDIGIVIERAQKAVE